MRRVLVAGFVASAVAAFSGSAGAGTAIKGAGADSVDPLMGIWQKAVTAAPLSTPVDYSADGSAAGRAEFINGGANFAVTGLPFTAAEQAKLTEAKKTFVYVPLAGGSLVFLYHLFTPQGESIKGLQLSGPTLTKMFTGVITDWNDAAIAAENPGVELPAKKVIPTVRGQAGGATYAATSYFRYSAPAVWKAFMEDPQRGFPDEPRELFPFFAGADSRTSSFAVADIVGSNESSNGRIAYVDAAWAKGALANGADVMKIKNAAGVYVAPSPASTQKTLDAAKLDDKNLLTIDYGVTDPGAYPLATINYMVVPTSGTTPDVASSLATLAKYAVGTGQAAATTVGAPVLPAPVVARSQSVLAATFPADSTSTTSTTAPAGGSTDVSGAELSNGFDSGSQLAFTGGPELGLWLGSGFGLVAAGSWVRRRVRR